jgi:hypothetical protein
MHAVLVFAGDQALQAETSAKSHEESAFYNFFDQWDRAVSGRYAPSDMCQKVSGGGTTEPSFGKDQIQYIMVVWGKGTGRTDCDT